VVFGGERQELNSDSTQGGNVVMADNGLPENGHAARSVCFLRNG
jgi:hypothetical protein